LTTLIGLKVYSVGVSQTKHRMSVRQQIVFYVGSLIVMIPSIYTAALMVNDTAREENLKTFISKELTNHYVFDNSIDKKSKMVTLKVVGGDFKKQEIEKLEKKMGKYNLGNYKLKIEQLSNQKYLTAQDLSKYLKEENLNEKLEKVISPVENQNKIALENDLRIVENILYKNFASNINEVKIGKLIDANNNENFVVLVVGNETMTDEISEKIKNLEFNTEKKYEIIVEKQTKYSETNLK
jgi:hypothetical protein